MKKYLRIIQSIFLVILITIISCFLYLPNYIRWRKLKETDLMLSRKIALLEKKIRELREQEKDLKTDPYVLEKIARESMGVLKNNEIVVDIER